MSTVEVPRSHTLSSLERLRSRFEVAVGNFGRSCIALQSNEKAFQAWFAACVIQEFGLSRVYREVHLDKPSLFEQIVDHHFVTGLRKGNELFADLSVSWEPDLDTRHSRTRTQELASASAMLSQLAIITELKVTGSTSAANRGQLRRDFRKLALFAAALAAARRAGPDARGLATYMVILDNFRARDGQPHPRYRREAFAQFLSEIEAEWPAHVDQPTTLLLSPAESSCVVHTFRGLGRS